MLTGIIIAKNEQKMIEDCLISLQFVDQIIVVDSGSTDNTNEIAKKYGAKIVKSGGTDYSQFRNAGLKAAAGDWVLYIDADERVSPLLRQEILETIKKPLTHSAYDLLRQNIYLGKHLTHGGWGDDYVTRLLYKSHLSHWVNPLHEQPVFKGTSGKLTAPLIHFSHRDLSSMVDKTLFFTKYEAQLRFDAGHPPMVLWRFVRVILTEFWFRFIKLAAWKDGPEGIIDGIFQVYNTFIIYARLWELQRSAHGN
jgi:glycosyltransferase involved in cell wall biosynthesis